MFSPLNGAKIVRSSSYVSEVQVPRLHSVMVLSKWEDQYSWPHGSPPNRCEGVMWILIKNQRRTLKYELKAERNKSMLAISSCILFRRILKYYWMSYSQWLPTIWKIKVRLSKVEHKWRRQWSTIQSIFLEKQNKISFLWFMRSPLKKKKIYSTQVTSE